jgi:Ca2+-binding EF-hand superfamily protein
MYVMSWSLKRKDRARVRHAFSELDRSNQGTVSFEELAEVLKQKFNASDEQVIAIFRSLDTTGDDLVRYSEFLAAMCSCPSRIEMTEEHCLETFRRLDVDGTGYITPEKLQNVLGLRQVEATRFVQEVDKARDNMISFEEFVDAIKRMTMTIEEAKNDAMSQADTTGSASTKSSWTSSGESRPQEPSRDSL